MYAGHSPSVIHRYFARGQFHRHPDEFLGSAYFHFTNAVVLHFHFSYNINIYMYEIPSDGKLFPVPQACGSCPWTAAPSSSGTADTYRMTQMATVAMIPTFRYERYPLIVTYYSQCILLYHRSIHMTCKYLPCMHTVQ